MKKLSLILIALTNLSYAEPRDCCIDFRDCKTYVDTLESQATVLNQAILDTRKSNDSALTELEKETPETHLPWYFYTGLGMIAGGIGARFLLK